ncbi:MAG: glycosyltransferase family 2 protein [Cytophagales bacterium]|nr:glycosyltransferase [Bernardetiaceae bacterium]MDW8211120.1 glycosyltransferase family 2 protein [Cytophagales bacterium]
MSSPLCSIITVTYNAAAALPTTMQSVAALSFQHFEWIIVDGASQDDTPLTVHSFQRHYPYIELHFFSQKDKGIYDAMNKGIDLAKGQWLCFMNAGDAFSSPDVLERIFASVLPSTEVVYGNYRIIYPTGLVKLKRVPEAPPPLWKGMVINHQSMLIKKQWAQRFPYRIDAIAADYIQMVELLKAGAHFQHLDIFIADYQEGGISSKHKIDYLKQCQQVALEFFPEKSLQIKAHFAQLFRQYYFTAYLQKNLPARTFYFLMKLKQVFYNLFPNS